MKKQLLLMLFVSIALLGFSQSAKIGNLPNLNLKTSGRLVPNEPLPTYHRSHYTPLRQTRSGELQETFDSWSVFHHSWQHLDDNWALYSPANSTNLTNHTTGDNNGFVIHFNMYNLSNGTEGHLITPEMQITSTDTLLTFWIDYYDINIAAYGAAGELYVAVSSDGGATWDEDGTNVIDGKGGQPWFQYSLNFKNFNGGHSFVGDTVMVQLRAVSDWGGASLAVDDFDGPAIVIPDNPNVHIFPYTDGYTQQPKFLNPQFSFGVLGENAGKTDTNDIVTNITENSTGYSTTVTFYGGLIYNTERNTKTNDAFTSSSVGTDSILFNLNLTGNTATKDTKDTLTVSVTDTTMARDGTWSSFLFYYYENPPFLIGQTFEFSQDVDLTSSTMFFYDKYV